MSDVRGGSRSAQGPRSGHDVTGLDINLNLDFLEAQVGCEALDSEAVIWLQTAAWLRIRSLSLGLTGAQWLRVCQPEATTLHGPAADGGSPVLFTSICELELTVEPPTSTCCRQVGLLYRFGKFQTSSPVTASCAKGPKQNLGRNASLKFYKALMRFWSANLLHQVWRSCEFFVLLLFRLGLFNYKTKFIPFLN